jgi:hypothetical protein
MNVSPPCRSRLCSHGSTPLTAINSPSALSRPCINPIGMCKSSCRTSPSHFPLRSLLWNGHWRLAFSPPPNTSSRAWRFAPFHGGGGVGVFDVGCVVPRVCPCLDAVWSAPLLSAYVSPTKRNESGAGSEGDEYFLERSVHERVFVLLMCKHIPVGIRCVLGRP